MKRELDGVTAKTFSKRLRDLRCQGFVERHVEVMKRQRWQSLSSVAENVEFERISY